ncbi:MAG TPA: hypothetical protein VFA50_19715 [Stellaceae bacterium]|nr:hypothetical protein [Stellaceae bacterium]
MTRSARGWRRAILLGALGIALTGCVAYAPPPSYGYAYEPGYYAAAPGYYYYPPPAYYAPPVFSSFGLGFSFGGHHHHHWD